MTAADHGGPRLDLYQVLRDPARRAPMTAPWPASGSPRYRVAEPPLRAGLVLVERPRPVPSAASRDENIGLAVLADLALRYLAWDRGRPW